MPRHVLKAALLCAVLALPVSAQERGARIHLPEPGETDEWCITPIVWGAGQDAQALREALVAQGQARAYLGVQLGPLTEAKAKELKVDGSKGALVREVISDSPASKAGLKANDVIVAVDGQSITSEEQLRELLLAHKEGDSVSLEVVRDGKRQKIQATLAERMMFGDVNVFTGPDGEHELFRGRMPEGFRMGEPYVMMFPGTPKLGVSVLPMTNDLREFFGVERGKGVLVSAVSKGSAADRAGLRAGDVVLTVDGDTISRTGDIAIALRKKGEEGPRTVQIEIIRDRSRQTLSATVEEQKLMNEE